MNLYRFRIVPESAWRTPWQSDTFSGLLCGAIARLDGNEVLRREVIEPALAGRPPFVVSDAFPGDRLPVPAFIRLFPSWPPDERKAVKRARWLGPEAFGRTQRGVLPTRGDLIADSGFHESAQLHNTISRASNTTMGEGGLYSREETYLAADQDCLTVYVRLNAAFRDSFWRAVRELATDGFGADRSAGKGQFRVDGELEPADFLECVNAPGGVLVLSTFQPDASDPTNGAWEAFTKYGKLGPDFGLDNVFKRPMILLRPGACFRCQDAPACLGRAIPMSELLAPDAVTELEGKGVAVVHWAFGLCVPLNWPQGELSGQEPATIGPAESVQPPQPEPQILQRTPQTLQDPDKVVVKVLERRDMGGKIQFFVQEKGKPRGVLAYGNPPPPDQLPEVDAVIEVYRNNRDVRNPQYRWDKPASSQGKPKGGFGGQRPRGRR